MDFSEVMMEELKTHIYRYMDPYVEGLLEFSRFDKFAISNLCIDFS